MSWRSTELLSFVPSSQFMLYARIPMGQNFTWQSIILSREFPKGFTLS